MSAFQIAGVVTAGIIGTGGLLSFLWAVGKVRGVETSISILSAANDATNKAYHELEQRQERERRECAAALAEMRGRVDVLTGDFGKQIAKSIIEAVKEET